jgi:alkanesulfonate monooxygenase SsuD/methylene tetrahydromethanopterin reductase-like flavin-dependent oxidoreductase (luciferase family)
MALRTQRIRLGTEVTPLARRRPWKLARETVTLDHLSNGRLILGVGLGASDDTSFTHFGEEIAETVTAMMLELTSAGNLRTSTLRAFDHDQMQAIIERVG